MSKNRAYYGIGKKQHVSNWNLFTAADLHYNLSEKKEPAQVPVKQHSNFRLQCTKAWIQRLAWFKINCKQSSMVCTYNFAAMVANEILWTDLTVSQLWFLTIAIISVDVPGKHMWLSAGPGPSSGSPKQWKSDSHVKIYNSCERQIATNKIQMIKFLFSNNRPLFSKSALFSQNPRTLPCSHHSEPHVRR